MSGQSGGRLRLSKLNEQLTCKLCGGYFIDATTIIECLHSFCRSCIVKYLDTNKYCPICEVQVHKSKPLLNIRPDHTLQDIVYKLVPGCYQNEMRCRREFYEKHPEAQLASMSPEARGEPIESHIYSPDESLSLSLEYFNPTLNESPIPCAESDEEKSGSSTDKKQQLPRRYLRCPAAVTVFHLQKLIRAKYGLSDAHRVDVMYKEEALYGNYTLMDVMYIYHWRRKVPLHLSYRIFESSPKRQKLSDDNTEFKQTLTNAGISHPNTEEQQENGPKREWTEVQLKISETGVMSVTGITNPDAKKVPKTESMDEQQRRLDDSVTSTKPTLKAEKSEQVNKRKSTDEPNRLGHSSDTQKTSGDSKSSEQCPAQKTTKATVVKNENIKVEKVVSSKNPRLNESTSDALDKHSSNQMSSGSSSTSSTSEFTSKAQEKVRSQSSGENRKNQGSSQASGSKIDALSAKLQFQPKVGQVNNTYSKKGQKEKKTILEKVLKKTDSKNETKEKMSRTSGGGIVANLSNNKSQMSSLQSSSKTMMNSQSSSSPLNTYGSCTYSTAPSVSISITSRRNSSPDRGKDSPGSGLGHGSSRNENSEGSNQRLRQNNNPPSNESLANIGLNVSTSLITLGQSSSSNFPYTVQDLVNSAMLKSPSKNLTSSQSGFNLQTPSMSVFSIPTSTTMKNNVFSANNNNNSNSSNNNNNQNNSGDSPSTTSTTSSSGTTKSNTPKSNLEITSVYSAVPPCPDAIPISLMKPTVRKTEILAKGTNLNEICAKIGTSGSKINDICAKIGESSKERDKNKSETRTRPEIPDLLKITKKSISSSESSVQKHIPNIPNVPTYTPSNSLLMGSMDSKGNKSIGVASNSSTSGSSSMISQSSGGMLLKGSTSTLKKQSQPIRYKTLRDPPKSWNPTLSKKNDYVATKNQAKELQQSQSASMLSEGGSGSGGNRNSKSIVSEPAKIFKNRNMPRYLGNPASGVKPMYGATNEGSSGGSNKDGSKDQFSTSTGTGSTSKTSGSGVSMTKIDPKTLSPIVSSTNSPIVSPPPYSQNARSYQNTPFPRDMCRSTGSPLSPRNSPVNMLSTNPFIPSPTPNTNPRLIYSHYPSPFSDTARFPNPLIRPPIPPHSAFHSSLPPSINKLYQRTSYMPQASGSYGSNVISQPPTVQRIPPSSTHSSASPKSPKTSSSTSSSAASSTFNLAKTETQTSMNPSGSGGDTEVKSSSSNNEASSAFNLTKTPGSGALASDLSKSSPASGSGNPSAGSSTSGNSNQSSCPSDKSNNQSNNQGNSSGKGKEASKESREESSNKRDEAPSKQKDSEKSEKKDGTNDNPDVQKTRDDKPSVKENSENAVVTSMNSDKSSNKVNGGLTVDFSGTSQSASDKSTEKTKSTTDDVAELPAKDKKVETLDKRVENKDNLTASESKCDELAKSGEPIQGKKSQANKAES